jgi:hypothetical protein
MRQRMQCKINADNEYRNQQGAGIYNKAVLKIYDALVISFENPFIWKCPSRRVLDFYNRNISGNHLDVGVGTGYFLDNCRFPVSRPKISLLDINPHSLQTTARRIKRYHPLCHQANILKPLHLNVGGFQTIGMNFLLHCLPGSLLIKGKVFGHLKPYLNPGGTLFGSTILGKRENFELLGRLFSNLYNSPLFPRLRVLDNLEDDVDHLVRAGSEYFKKFIVDKIGHVTFFVGYN